MAASRENLRIAIIGAGRLGTALAQRLSEAGVPIEEIVLRNSSESAGKWKLSKELRRAAVPAKRARLSAKIVWFCVPDSKIADSAEEFSDREWKGKIALHSSGVLASEALAELWRRGASVASVHPLMTFVSGSIPELRGVPFAVEGDAEAVKLARRIVKRLGGVPFRVRKQEKLAYHAFATMICPLLVSLLVASEEVATMAGLSRREARQRMVPIVWQTLENYRRLGRAASFSGPIVRGDVETVAHHLEAIRKRPAVRRLYSALALAALEYLPNKNRKQLRAVLAA
jgi:predicted short-subunit dehydrogenase-like oxidoreductase (DUF2520 family)